MERIYVFLALFSLVYFFEAIGGSYIIAAIQNIEKQFQIPSKFSGFMISASDIGYIPSVLLISYLGSRGNRARWIGGGAIMMAITYLMIASPHFLFPTAHIKLNETDAEKTIRVQPDLLMADASLAELLAYPLIKDRIPKALRSKLLALKLPTSPNISPAHLQSPRNSNFTYFSIDSWILDQVFEIVEEGEGDDESERVTAVLKQFINRRVNSTEKDILKLKRSAIAPFSYCGELVNTIRRSHAALRCQDTGSNSGAFVIMFTALFFLGIGRTMPWSLGVPLLDDNIKKKNLPVYFAAISFIRILGPICGHLIGSFTNKVYYTLSPPSGLSASDPTWIGAWWIGFLIIGTITLFPSFFLFFFPTGRSKIESAEAQDDTKKSIVLFDKHKEKNSDESVIEKAKGFIKSYKDVLRTKIYIGAAFGRIVDILAFKGYIVFLPKYLENHFGIPLFRVHQYMAAFGVFGFAMGAACGGIITRKFKFSGRQAAMFVLIVSSLNLALFFSKVFISCDSIVQKIALNNKLNEYNFTQNCNQDCGCEAAKLYPVCSPSGYTFYSPCHAGCREVKVKRTDSHDIEFSSCECVPEGIVRKDFCQDDCKWPTVIFFSTVLTGAFFAGMGLVPGMLILLRSVPPATRSASLGLQGLLVSLFGTLPSPVLWGAIVDSACLVWEQNCQGGNGSCSIFDAQKLRWRMHVMYVMIRGLSLITDLYVWYYASNLNILDEEEENDKSDEINTNNQIAMKELERSPSLR